MLESSLKNKSQHHLSEEIFQPPDSKSLRLRCAAFEMLLSHGVCSPFKHPLLSVLLGGKFYSMGVMIHAQPNWVKVCGMYKQFKRNSSLK